MGQDRLSQQKTSRNGNTSSGPAGHLPLKEKALESVCNEVDLAAIVGMIVLKTVNAAFRRNPAGFYAAKVP